jgi:hydrophobe/amphiphile efflux-1 (HAE1) family protein
MTEPSEFDNIIIRAASGGAAIVRLKDIGHAELGQKDYSIRSSYQGRPATMLAVYQQPGANALDVASQVKATLARMQKDFPEGIEYKVVMDTTNFTRASISDVVHTFFEAVILVVLVVYLFLQSFRATLIPVLAVPVSIIGTFIGMQALGFSINMLTLFGMVLAIGIVVDDAIVVIENVERNMNVHKLPPKEAAKRAMDEVSGPVIAIVLVLCAVFVPVAFMTGITGQLYKQFAITIAISVVISGLVALTLSPALAAILLKPVHGKKNRFFRWFDRNFERMTQGYSRAVALIIKRAGMALLLFVGMIALSVVMLKKVPGAFLPPEDQGYLLGAVIMPDAASLDRTGAVGKQVTDYFMKNPAVEGVAVIDGYSLLDNQNKNNAGTFFVGFKDFGERYVRQYPHAEREHRAAGGRRQTGRRCARHRGAGESAVDPGPGHHRRPRGLGPEQGRQERAAAGRGGGRLHGAAEEGAGDRARHGHLQRQLAAIAGRRRPRQGRDARGAGRGSLRHAADHVRVAVRVAVHQVEPLVAGDPAGRTGLPPASRGPGAPVRAQPRQGDGAAVRGGHQPLRDGAGPDDPL